MLRDERAILKRMVDLHRWAAQGFPMAPFHFFSMRIKCGQVRRAARHLERLGYKHLADKYVHEVHGIETTRRNLFRGGAVPLRWQIFYWAILSLALLVAVFWIRSL